VCGHDVAAVVVVLSFLTQFKSYLEQVGFGDALLFLESVNSYAVCVGGSRAVVSCGVVLRHAPHCSALRC
jgi:hypothetical protein